jgi:hypothetical protein
VIPPVSTTCRTLDTYWSQPSTCYDDADPEAWDGNKDMDPVKKAFYEYHACLMEPWDGPASISFTDGKIIGVTLDRNGLRPSRYCVTTDDRVIMSSESGTLPVDPSTILKEVVFNLVKCSWWIWTRNE